MMKYALAVLVTFMLGACTANVDLDCDAAETLSREWGEGLTAVVAEGEGEPRSVGSYSVRVYEARNGDNDRDFFVTGLIFARDGFLVDLDLVDIDGDQNPDLIVSFESAGSGSYLTAHAWRLLDNKLSSVAMVEGLAPGTDVTQALIAQVASLNALEPE